MISSAHSFHDGSWGTYEQDNDVIGRNSIPDILGLINQHKWKVSISSWGAKNGLIQEIHIVHKPWYRKPVCNDICLHIMEVLESMGFHVRYERLGSISIPFPDFNYQVAIVVNRTQPFGLLTD